jgi:predicted chitinase
MINNLFTGCVENRKDPLKLGRCQVRIVGVHTHDKIALPTEDLPWAYPLQPITSAAMNGIGHTPVGVVEGTWVVLMFRDQDMQEPIILGTVGGIPQKESYSVDSDEDDQISLDSVEQTKTTNSSGEVVSSDQGYLRDSQGNVVSDGSGNPIAMGAGTITENTNPSTATSVGKTPPAKAAPGIEALKKAMDRNNVMGKYGRAAILGIVGGESEWVPKNEGYNYSADALKAVFSKTFKNNDNLANKYARWKGTIESFFEFVYAPENNGSQLGNTQSGDGGRFFGRGFIQLTGRSNYARYANLTKIDILGNPDLLNIDIDASAEITVRYFMDRVQLNSEDPAYFQAALKAVGGARSGWPKKESYYLYFLGEAPPPAQTDKTTKPGEEVQQVETSAGLPQDRQKNVVVGFSDPNMKYPLRKYIGEPDTNRLARGRIDGTIVEFKDEKRLDGIPTAGGGTWSQPDIPYNAKYPFNKVIESESGHVLELDDTPENERIHLYHRKGTYLEVDPNGSRVQRIVGDGYEIIDRNGYIFIAGQCNVTIGGVARVLCQNDAFIDIAGDAKLNVMNNLDFNVASNMSLNVGGSLKIKSGGGISMESQEDFNLSISGSNKQTSSGNIEFNAAGRANIEGSTVHFAEGAATAESSGLGAPISTGTKSSQTFNQLKPPPRNIEKEMEYETPEENQTEGAKVYHENRETQNTSEKAQEVASAEAPKNEAAEVRGSCELIYSMSSIPDSYVIHTDSTGYKWTVGSITRGNAITPIKWKGKDLRVQDIVCNMKGLAENILGPINETIGKVGSIWTLTSGYRNNIPSGGSATSQHLIGCAVDFVCGSNNFAYELNYECALKLASLLPYDQLLLEYRDPGVNGNRNPKRINWIHISYNNSGGGRKQALTFLNDKTYKQGFVNLAA